MKSDQWSYVGEGWGGLIAMFTRVNFFGVMEVYFIMTGALITHLCTFVTLLELYS